MATKQKHTIICAILTALILYRLFWGVKTILGEGFSISVNWEFLLSYLPTIFGLVGVIVFFTSAFQKSSLFSIYLCVNIISIPLWLVSDYIFINSLRQRGNLEIPYWFFISVILSVVVFITSFIGLQLIGKTRAVKLNDVTIGDEQFSEFSPAPALMRFANRLIDVAILLFVVVMNARYVNVFLQNDRLKSFVNSEIGLISIEFAAVLYFYLLLEGIFNTTPGKCATGTTIVNENGQRPGFGRILGRTLARFIPFDPLSFFGSSPRGWHDSVSGTYVVETVRKKDEKELL